MTISGGLREDAPGVAGTINRALEGFSSLVLAGAEIISGQLGIGGLEPISTEAGRLLLDVGVVASLDDGILLFHERIGRNKPGLRSTLRKVDERAGRRKKPRRSPAQKAMDNALRAGEVKRVKGKITGLTAKGKKAVRAAKRATVLRAQKARKKRQVTARAKLSGIGRR